MAHQPIEQLDVFALYEEVSAWVWKKVKSWDSFARNTIGDQLVRSIDSVNANLVEGDGRYSTSDSLRFFVIARASARESRLWIQRAVLRELIEESEGKNYLDKLERATRLLNLLIDYRRKSKSDGLVREETAPYETNFELSTHELADA